LALVPRRPTLSDVAAIAGVSSATVSRVLNSDYPVAASTRHRVLQAVRSCNYVPNAHAQALVSSRSHMIGVVLADVSDPFFSEVVRGVQTAAKLAGRLVVICNTESVPEQELEYVSLLRTQRADAVLVVGAAPLDRRHGTEMARHAEGLANDGAALVYCGRPRPPGARAGRVVALDNLGAGALAARRLLAAGHRDLLYLAGPEGRTTTRDRLQGVLVELGRQGVPSRRLQVAYGPFDRTTGYREVAVRADAGALPSAILAGNDLLAIGALAALRDRGIQVPGDVSVIGIDDIPAANDLTPRLTTVRLPLTELGQLATRVALGLAPANARTSPASLMERESVRPVGSAGPRAPRDHSRRRTAASRRQIFAPTQASINPA
jgi:LacI family transcriptional regulator